MLKPMISNLIRVVDAGRGEFRVIADDFIPEGTLIEVCPTVHISNRLAIIMAKSISSIESKFIIDQEAVDKEYEVFAELGEMELERRLDAGQISPNEYSQILSSKVNVNALLEAKTHVLPLGYGQLYRISDTPNMVRTYYSNTKLCTFKTVQYIQAGTELTYFN
jgi:hypothetical protein